MSKYSVKALMKDAGKNTCVICGKQFNGYGNNPWPVADKGRCCDECNFSVVLPARLEGLVKNKKTKDSIQDLDALIKSEDEAIQLYKKAITNAGDGIEKSIYEEILKDEEEHLEKLTKLKEGYSESIKIQ